MSTPRPVWSCVVHDHRQSVAVTRARQPPPHSTPPEQFDQTPSRSCRGVSARVSDIEKRHRGTNIRTDTELYK